MPFQRSYWFACLACLVLFDGVSSWTNAPTPVVAARNIESYTVDLRKIDIHPSKKLEECLDEASVFRLCDIGSTKYGRGLVARKDMDPGETILRIPLSQTVVVEMAQTTQSISDAWAGQLAQKLLDLQEITKEDTDGIVRVYSDALPPPPPTPARGDWSLEAVRMLDDANLAQEIEIAKDWRNQQWEAFGENNGAVGDQQRFLDALDLVSSRTIRCGSKFMLVPFLDMANYASRDQGGGFFTLEKGNQGEDEIELKIGDRGVKAGDEVLLDYGDRKNEEWLIYYGFLPDRNMAESLVLSKSKREITWNDVNSEDKSLKEECMAVLDEARSTLGDDIQTLKKLENDEENSDITKVLALKYRIARKTLLTAVAGAKTTSVFSSAFL